MTPHPDSAPATGEVQSAIIDRSLAARQERATALGNVERIYTPAQIEVIKNTIAIGATPDELQMFITVCQRTGKDPFLKQIHFVKRWNSELKAEVGSIQIGVDGYRLDAARSGRYEGSTLPLFCGKDGKWTELWTDPEHPPFAAKVGVRVAGLKEPIYAIARFWAYAQKKKDGGLTRMWAERGPEQLAKCAETLALRIAFPTEVVSLDADDDGYDPGPQEIQPRAAVVEERKQQAAKKVARDAVAEVLADAPATLALEPEPTKPAEDDPADAPTDGAVMDDTAGLPDSEPGDGDSADDPRSDEDKAEVLANSGDSLGEVTLVLASLRQAARDDGRQFYQVADKNGRQRVALTDGKILTAIGYVQQGKPVPQWLDNMSKAPKQWLALCVQLVKVGKEYGIEVVR